MSILGANFLVPIFVMPIISKAYGGLILEQYLYAQVLLAFCSVIVDWSFSTTGIKELRKAKDEVQTAIDIIAFRILVYVILFSLVVVYNLITYKYDDFAILLIILMSGISVAISPVFYYQYKESIKGYAIINVISKCLFLVICVYLSNRSDGLLYILLAFFISQVFSPLLFLIRMLVTNPSTNVLSLKNGLILGRKYFRYFTASLSSSIYRVFPSVLAGQLYQASPAYAPYLVADRVVRGGNSLLQPLTNTLLPIVLKNGLSKFAFIPYLLLGILLSSIYLLFGTEMTKILVVDDNFNFNESNKIYSILWVMPVIISMSSYLGNQVLLVKGKLDYIAKVIAASALFFYRCFISIF
jgi:PST family polysaccharide transporter